jgi:Asp-tRNA(Asn)/Glu-tRNA(Gln) amidotransferase B subunit
MLGAAREAAAGEQAVGAALTDEEVGQVAEEIKTVMAELPPDELAAIAKDLDLSPEEVRAMVREPDFARLVAEEQARLG